MAETLTLERIHEIQRQKLAQIISGEKKLKFVPQGIESYSKGLIPLNIPKDAKFVTPFPDKDFYIYVNFGKNGNDKHSFLDGYIGYDVGQGKYFITDIKVQIRYIELTGVTTSEERIQDITDKSRVYFPSC